MESVRDRILSRMLAAVQVKPSFLCVSLNDMGNSTKGLA